MVRPASLILSALIFLPVLAVSASAQSEDDEVQENQVDDFSDVQAELKGNDGSDNIVSPAPPAVPDSELGDEALQAPDGSESTIRAESEKTLERMAAIIQRIDEGSTREGNNWQLTLDERQILVITDANAGRMRIMTPIAAVEDLPEGGLVRLMQANFDSALDARYAIAQDLVWGTFISPLPSLTDRDFASGLLQTKTVADTFGTTFTSGAVTFGGGDSNAIIGEQLEELLKELEKGNEI